MLHVQTSRACSVVPSVLQMPNRFPSIGPAPPCLCRRGLRKLGVRLPYRRIRLGSALPRYAASESGPPEPDATPRCQAFAIETAASLLDNARLPRGSPVQCATCAPKSCRRCFGRCRPMCQCSPACPCPPIGDHSLDQMTAHETSRAESHFRINSCKDWNPSHRWPTPKTPPSPIRWRWAALMVKRALMGVPRACENCAARISRACAPTGRSYVTA